MTEDPNEKAGKQVTGVVTAYYGSEGDQDPHNVYIEGEKFSTFDDETADPIEEGIEVTFRTEKNGRYWNIKDGTVAVVDTDPDYEPDRDAGSRGSIRNSEGVNKNGGGDGQPFESPRDRSIRCNVALKQARELCQPLMAEDMSEDRFHEVEELVAATAETFAAKLRELNHGNGGEA